MINTPPGKPTIRRDGDCIVVHIPMTFKRRGGRKEIIVPQGLDGKTSPNQAAQNAILVAINRAFRWKNLVESGRVKNLAEIARANRVDISYVSRILDLTLLAPDIIDAILDGREPSGHRSPCSRRSKSLCSGRSNGLRLEFLNPNPIR